MGEAVNVGQILLDATRAGMRLCRNNRGMFLTLDGLRKVRAGLSWDKSGDLIGGVQVQITPEMVGTTLLVFASVEVKKTGWKKPTNKHEREQEEFAEKIRKLGGFACIAPGIEIIKKELDLFYKAHIMR